MRYRIVSILITLLALGLDQGLIMAQSSTGSVPLGDVARQFKGRQVPSSQKPKVYTNDDLSLLPPRNIESSPSSEKDATEEKAVETGKEQSVGKEPAKAAEKAHGEKYYREQMSKLRDRLEIDRRQLSVLEQKLGQNQIQYYPDPNKGLLQESGPTARSDIQKLQDQIAKKKAEVASDEEAIENLREQLRREGGEPSWVR